MFSADRPPAPADLMSLALEEAKKGSSFVRPNPQVGAAVYTKCGQIRVAHHARYGQAHAEQALVKICQDEGLSLEGSIWAVTLEPCAHVGKTPSCAHLLASLKVSEVHVAVLDPNPKVNSKGLEILQNADIKTTLGFLKDEATQLNSAWLFAQKNRRPKVTLKMATSMDGCFFSANGESKWITSRGARLKSMELRASADVILTSLKTLETDEASFSVRDKDDQVVESFQPKLVIASRNGLLSDRSEKRLLGRETQLLNAFNDLGHFRDFLNDSFKKGDYHIVVEAGPEFLTFVMKTGLVDEIWHFQALKYLGASVGKQQGLGVLLDGALPGVEFETFKLFQVDSQNFLTIMRKNSVAQKT